MQTDVGAAWTSSHRAHTIQCIFTFVHAKEQPETRLRIPTLAAILEIVTGGRVYTGGGKFPPLNGLEAVCRVAVPMPAAPLFVSRKSNSSLDSLATVANVATKRG